MTNKYFLPFLIFLVASGCSTPVQQFTEMRDANRLALSKVEINMSRAQVIAIMGERSAEDGFLGRFENPYRRDLVRASDERSYEVLYYYTQRIGDQPIDSGLTPIVILDGKVSGVGWSFLDSIFGSTTTIRRR